MAKGKRTAMKAKAVVSMKKAAPKSMKKTTSMKKTSASSVKKSMPSSSTSAGSTECDMEGIAGYSEGTKPLVKCHRHT